MMKNIISAAVLLFAVFPVLAEEIPCPGVYDGHLQGIAVDADGNIYWSFTVALVKTDGAGRLEKKIDVPGHHGDLWIEKEMLYAAMNHRAGEKGGPARRSWIYAYHTADLSLAWKKEIPEVADGAGALAMRDGHFFIASGRRWKKFDVNQIYEYDEECSFIRRHDLESGYTYLGIQTMAFEGEKWWFGCYGEPRETLRAGMDFTFEARSVFESSLGIAPLAGGGFYIGRGSETGDGKHTGRVIRVRQPDPAGEPPAP